MGFTFVKATAGSRKKSLKAAVFKKAMSVQPEKLQK
jgi:hypothetical protein